jgi:hypothetical protein
MMAIWKKYDKGLKFSVIKFSETVMLLEEMVIKTYITE